ncbi:MAG: hypothetical protein IPG89_11205 [Bacteroidetes bacterium]|nr:hypothetical protein [Bacteroidota bacterium]
MDYKNTIQTYVDLINLDSQEFRACLAKIYKGTDEDYIKTEKQHLVNRITLMYQLGIFEYRSQYWRIRRGKLFKKYNIDIDVEFIPIAMSFTKSSNGNIGSQNKYCDTHEWNFLIDLATKYSVTEKYDKVELVKNRLKELIP